ncbi:MAG: N-6 DNA methylase [Lutibacter sp.]|jgi:type I restriction-modification system DNA methylase subunit/REP element-mobilizing transposase RayT
MPLFQSSVIKKHLQSQNKELLTEKWIAFQQHFHNSTIQENIRNSKEEQYQGGFIIDLFVNILGYTKNPTPNFNITTEYKNVKDSKKADGAIIINNNVKAVVELKGTNTTDLGKIEVQAFGYKNNQPECTYVITSNFEKLRFYIDNAIEHIEFNLFTLTEKEFNLLYLCLAYENIEKDIPKKIKDQSISQEDAITKKLYNDYSLFKRELHQNLVLLNPQYDALELFKKSQKLLDRFLFLFFSEDRQLLPPNSVRMILDQWKTLQELDEEIPLYNRFKKYFEYLNTGFKGKKYDVFAYNGGLFKPDEILDTIKIDDKLLFEHALNLSQYDFDSEVDVNILGHIFENSLNELDEIKAQLEGQIIDKTKSKRKKDGVFYTPKYITKYIVENTVGKLCEEKKTELQIVEDDYITDKKRQKKTIKPLIDKLTEYRNWLLQLTICDPACGSGAFLNQALDFLINEHKYIDELQAKLFGDAMVLSDVEKSILENNLFGVDLNEESVEIAKLSLWLRTAQPNRKLNDLNNNIKCGNSLIDDPEIAGEKAFNWENEFPQIFKEKSKKAFHITTAVHDSRTSQRMIDYKVREKRHHGANPYPTVNYFTNKDEFIITQTIATIVKEDHLNVMAYNICADHIHLLLVCEEEEVSKIVQKIKSVTSKEIHRTREQDAALAREHALLPIEQDATSTREHAPLPIDSLHAPLPTNSLHAPLPTKNALPLWTQKFGCKEIESETQLTHTLEYIKNNRAKHNLPPFSKEILLDKGECSLAIDIKTSIAYIIENMLCNYDDAFNNEYKGGFDVVIGNPPYVFARDNFKQDEKDFFVTEYISAKYQINTYLLFIKKSVYLLKGKGIYGLIIPNAWLMVYSGEGLRKFLLSECKINQIINLEGYSFESANVETVILLAKKEKTTTNSVEIFLNNGNEFYLSHYKKQQDFQNEQGCEFKVFLDDENDSFNLKITTNTEILDDLVDIKAGLQAYEKGKGEPKQTADDVKNRPFDYNYQFDNETYKYLEGKDVNRYSVNWSGLYLKYGKHLAAPRDFNLFDGEKIIVREITGNFPRCLISTFSEDLFLYNRSNIAIVNKTNSTISLKYITVVLNSKLMSYYFLKNTAKSVRKLFPKIILNDLRKFPIKNITFKDQRPFIEKADIMLALNKELQEVSQKYQRVLLRKFELEILPKKLQEYYLLTYSEFIKELAKKKVKLSLSEEAEWEDYFLQEQQKALTLKTQIENTDKEIDAMVYALYGLTEEEIEILEKS